MATIHSESLGTLHQKLMLTLTYQDYQDIYSKKLKQTAQNINMPGFRKGHAPKSLVEKMYGNSILFDEAYKLGQQKIDEYIKENNISILYYPLLVKLDFENKNEVPEKSIIQEYEIGLSPNIDLSILKNIDIDTYKIGVSDDAVKEQVKKFQEDFALKKIVEQVQDWETTSISGAIYLDTTPESEKHSCILPLKDIKDEFAEQYKLIKHDDIITFNINHIVDSKKDEYLNDWFFKMDSQDILKNNFKIKVNELISIIPHPINTDLFKTIFPEQDDIKTEEDFYKATRIYIEKLVNGSAQRHSIHLLSHSVSKHINYELPDAFIKKFFESQAKQNKDNKNQEVSIDDKELKNIVAFIKEELLHNAIINSQQLSVSREEIKNETSAHLLYQYGQFIQRADDLEKFTENMMADEKHVSGVRDNIMHNKIYKYILEQANKNEKEITQKEFSELVKKHNEEHHHHH